MPDSSLADKAKAAVDALLSDLAEGTDKLIHEVGVENFKAGLDAWYDRRIAPFDVPYVLDAAEPVLIDMPAKAGLRRIFDGLHALVHRDPAPPTT